MTAAKPSDRADVRRRVRAIIIGSSGNLVEWYDFYVYAAFSLYFAKAFFPAGDETAQLLATAGIFAVGFLMRPLGAWFFGLLADRRGRKLGRLFDHRCSDRSGNQTTQRCHSSVCDGHARISAARLC